MGVNRCICHDVPFTELKSMLEGDPGTTLHELARKTGCGTGCGMCVPYIKRMMETGETDLPVMTRAEFEQAAQST